MQMTGHIMEFTTDIKLNVVPRFSWPRQRPQWASYPCYKTWITVLNKLLNVFVQPWPPYKILTMLLQV